MINLTFIAPDGRRHEISAAPGPTLMEVAVAHGVDGILADCGGNLVCGTCHVIVPQAYQARLGEQSEMEREMLECVPEPRPNTRLTCQIRLTEALDGLELEVPRLQR